MRLSSLPMAEYDWMSTSDAAERLGVSLRALYRLIDVGDVPAYKIGRVIRLRRHEVGQYLRDVESDQGR